MTMQAQWQFWIDRGGTFTDVVARQPDGKIVTCKLLSENPQQYDDAGLQGIADILGLDAGEPIPTEKISAVKMGTTIATNALLERKGEPTLLAITKGFEDQLRIGYQNRPDIYALNIQLPELLYQQVIAIDERVDVKGKVLVPLNIEAAEVDFLKAFDQGLRSIAIVLIHGYRYLDHEKKLYQLAEKIGFKQISVSHQVNPLIKLVSRGETTVIDAYLTPILKNYIDQVAAKLHDTQLYFMQSNGGLAKAEVFRGKDSILSGPAAGIVGAAAVSETAGFAKIISFDMGGTSTDVAHYSGEYEYLLENIIAGVHIRSQMMHIHTIAAGGGSILHFAEGRYQVGPDSAGANPGPACYRRDGPLTVTDCNVLLGRIQPGFFPKVFGISGKESLDVKIVQQQFNELATTISQDTHKKTPPESIAEGFLRIAVENMANAINKISVQRGYDVTEHVLCCFGGAGGQHACKVADTLGINKILLHPFAGILSAYGMGLAKLRLFKEQAVEKILTETLDRELRTKLYALEKIGHNEMQKQGVESALITAIFRVQVRYEGTDFPLLVDFGNAEEIQRSFATQHQQLYGYTMPERDLIVQAMLVEIIGGTLPFTEKKQARVKRKIQLKPETTVQMYDQGKWLATPLYQRENLLPDDCINGPAIIAEANSTTVIDHGWQAIVNDYNHLILQRVIPLAKREAIGTQGDPVMLEVFNNLFISIAEQMGEALRKTAYSVNIKERLDFSCAIFDNQGHLVANAQHIPVHLGSMSESVQAIINARGETIRKGDVFMLNDPYHGGTHLPDVTVITPVFVAHHAKPLFFVASRAHQADIGGITPGSVPPMNTNIHQEGILIDNFILIEKGQLREQALFELLTSGPWPVRNFRQNLADLKAQIAANQKGVDELNKMIAHFSLEVVSAYMQHVQDNAQAEVRKLIEKLHGGEFTIAMDNDCIIQVKVTINHKKHSLLIDFNGTSSQQQNNFNAPIAVCRAAVLYVFRTLIKANIPMNQGFLKPIKLIFPDNCMLNPKYPAAVVAGNVETSQCIVDALYGALGIMAAAQGTMNNFTFGNDQYQYYETICGGSGAGDSFHGTDAVHTHMTNTRLTDPEILEWRYPVLVDSFTIRRDSGGNGKWHGGDGVIRRIRFLETMTAAILSNRRRVPPYGMASGEPGTVGENYVIRANGKKQQLSSTDVVEMHPGDVFVIETPGGGGFGTAS